MIDVRTGTFSVPTSNTTNYAGGTFQAAAGAVLDLTGTNATISGNFTGSGAGTVRLSTGSLIVDPAGATFNFPAGLFQWTGGTIDGSAGRTDQTKARSPSQAPGSSTSRRDQ